MNTMLFPKISLVLNILVLIPVCSGIIIKANWAVYSYGIETPARGILLSIQIWPQVCYGAFICSNYIQLLSPMMVGTITNPVIISNIFIALFHSYGVWKIVLLEKINPLVS